MTNSVRVYRYYTRNLKNFENVKVGYEAELDVQEGQTFEEVRKRLVEKVEKWVEQDLAEIDSDAK